MNRNHWFLIGMVVLLLGIQFRVVHSYSLTPEVTKVLAEQTDHPVMAFETLLGPEMTLPGKVVYPPEWLGWAAMSIGAVLILHALAMPRPT